MKNMKRKRIPPSTNKLFPLLILVATLFMGVGYASINSISLNINGEVVAKAQDGIFITEVKYVPDSNEIGESNRVINTIGTTLNSDIILSNTDSTSQITYEITIYNSTNDDYAYTGPFHDDNFYSNNEIIYEVSDSLIVGNILKPKNYITFNITFKYANNVVLEEISNNLQSYIIFNFEKVQIINYLESTGSQYIDAEIIPSDKLGFELEISLTDINTTSAIMGVRQSMDFPPSFNIFVYNPNSDTYYLRMDYVNTIYYAKNISLSVDSIINIKHNKSKIIFTSGDAEEIYEYSEEEFSSPSSLYIFNQNQIDSSETRGAYMKLYSLKFYENDEIVRDFLPALDYNGVPCLYDNLNKKYYYNIGTGDFLFG